MVLKVISILLLLVYLASAIFCIVNNLCHCLDKEDKLKGFVIAFLPVINLLVIIGYYKGSTAWGRMMSYVIFHMWEVFYESGLIKDTYDYDKMIEELEQY